MLKLNKSEIVVKEYLEMLGLQVEKLNLNKPDFLVNDDYYVEVKNLDHYNTSFLSSNQEIAFSKIKANIIVFFVKKGVIVGNTQFKSLPNLPNGQKTINVTFEDEEFNELEKAKGEMNWHDFVLKILPKKKGEQK